MAEIPDQNFLVYLSDDDSRVSDLTSIFVRIKLGKVRIYTGVLIAPNVFLVRVNLAQHFDFQTTSTSTSRNGVAVGIK